MRNLPRPKQTANELKSYQLVRNIKALKEYKGVSTERLAIAARCTERNIHNRYDDPGEFRLKELIAIADELDVSFEALISDNPLEDKPGEIAELKRLLTSVLRKAV